ncbi:MAG: exopolysaccharide biosynthesis polyprenyl glycosylphosphotransferase [Snodgrassella sp.]|uniref:exopolysaccharide biosynthesis polyprenyl glycosylphosphotransferase n=1 Tax=Snodgrassella sp. TaxID=2815304 RepID=UPI0025868692|nr:exopolysaccharide biosynthesis polyprenyl glycosylphosphotransferase [Snodgrassella sp.]MCO6508660.1 exopolysaccharide biosynthesis polyprenyl glycosylphosphotransferase [Snodgrassella sp.]MCO6513086.1 exopolysaccharide biosynthesis polyprenyl glycosylphosphotransferase [Snodgrassella sp.]MCO6518944.1 exopolysaccharide biosynthesis polyprenyl glycosylphosphotransferase [Snodgrassella sp.]MCO6521678.1 exopolysaccharide biosynthesis polyprenyl glycosylphosphotransferase [Snodgrassella sp.]MCO
MRSLLSYKSRLFFGTLLVMLLPLAIMEPIKGFSQGRAAFLTSIVLVGIAHILNTKSLSVFSNFPGRKSAVIALPHTYFWFFGMWMAAKFFNLPYTVWFLFIAGCVSLFLCVAYIYYRNKFITTYAYLPYGRALNADQLPNVNWIKLTSPSLPAATTINGIVADLHEPELDHHWQKFLARQTLNGMPVYNIRQVEEFLTGRVKIHHLYENDLGSLLPSPTYVLIKRVADILLILLSAPITLPVMLITAIAIKLESPGAILFRQNRVGRGGHEFCIYKFRSMCSDSEKNGAQMAQLGDARVTRIGHIIRKTRIDELPQFWNILKGDMSLIGPRPEQKVFVDQFIQEIPFYDYRHIVKPGISGWAQVTQGYAADTEQTQIKIEHDFYYIKHFSFSLDILIFFKTLKTMLTGFGAR